MDKCEKLIEEVSKTIYPVLYPVSLQCMEIQSKQWKLVEKLSRELVRKFLFEGK